MSIEIKKMMADFLEELEDELTDKQKGYVTEKLLLDRIFPEIEAPRMEVILLDEEDRIAAFRRLSDPLRGDEKGEWGIGNPEEITEDAMSWISELEEDSYLADVMNEPYGEEDTDQLSTEDEP